MIAAQPDLLVIGGLTVDRFADGSTAPGGSVLHIAMGAVPRGMRVAVLTVAGPEPGAQAGLAELRRLAVALESAEADATATFTHRDTAGGRRLRLECRGGRVATAGSALVAGAPAVLVAPIAGEVLGEELALLDAVPIRAAILQGWLRSLDEGAEVRPVPLDALGKAVMGALSRFDLLVASREDLAAESAAPEEQLAALRRVFGGRPVLVVTDGDAGAWLDAEPSGTVHLPVPWRVAEVSTVGAGDILAALLTVALGDAGDKLQGRMQAAMRTVAEVLEERRG